MGYSRTCIIATAGHVDHGKSTFVEKITGHNPDRLPEEKRRGMTIDLGFAHTSEFSFVDCPGHNTYIKHTISGLFFADGVCLIIALNEGLCEQTYEHLRIIRWLKIKQVLVVFTKTDLVVHSEIEDLQKKYFQKTLTFLDAETTIDHVSFSAQDSIDFVKEKIKNFFIPQQKTRDDSYNRLFIDRAFSLKGFGTIIAGTHIEGTLEATQEAQIWSLTKPKPLEITIKSLRNNNGRIAININHAKPQDIPRGSILILDRKNQFTTFRSMLLSLSWITPEKKQITALLQFGTCVVETKLYKLSSGLWKAVFPKPLPIKGSDKVLIRMPQRIKNVGHTVAGGTVIEQLVRPARPKLAIVNKVINNETDYPILDKIKNLKWQAVIPEVDAAAIKNLIQMKQLYRVDENHYLHPELHQELLMWLIKHFSKNETLSLNEAKDFFNVPRKILMALLEYCDRQLWTYRKNDLRYRFKIPKADAREDEKQSAQHPYLCL